MLYAVKSNPHPVALQNLWDAGVRHFDTASLGEIEAVKAQLPDAICHFMAPVRLPGQGKAAYEKHGVTDFVVDSEAELDKLLAETGNPKKLRVFVRLVASLGGALLEMSSKYGCRPEEAARLLKRVRVSGAQPCLTFHVGSQCLSPFSYAQAIEIAQQTVRAAGVEIAALGHRRRFSHRLCRTGAAALSLVFRHDQGGAGQPEHAEPESDVRAGPRAVRPGHLAGDPGGDAARRPAVHE